MINRHAGPDRLTQFLQLGMAASGLISSSIFLISGLCTAGVYGWCMIAGALFVGPMVIGLALLVGAADRL